ncbi:MAG: DUF1566 domain-containing protein [Pseudomonadota bacterium]
MNKLIHLLILLSLPWSAGQAQLCRRDSIPESTPSSRFTLAVDRNTATDTYTHLEWQRCPWGQVIGKNADNIDTCIGRARVGDWGSALRAAAAPGAGWRVPNIKELISIVDVQCVDPPFNREIFPAAWSGIPDPTLPVAYWSSTPGTGYGTNAAAGVPPTPLAWAMFTHDGTTMRFTRAQHLFAVFVRSVP